jgi:hypothetical protein
VRNLSCDTHLAVKPLEKRLIGCGLMRQELERYGLAQGQVGCPIHLTHSTPAKQADDAISASQ